MGSSVTHQIAGICESSAALPAWVRTCARVDAEVRRGVGSASEALRAERAPERFLSGVYTLVAMERATLRELSGAH